MKKILLVGRTSAGKTTLTQALQGREIKYEKTQSVFNYDGIIDTPGEYAENRILGRALALYAYEADVVGLLLASDDVYSLYSPNIVSMANREVIGIITKTDKEEANIPQTERWLEIAGCKKIFKVSALTGEGIDELLEFLTK